MKRAEIAGAGFGGLVAAVALAERGWSVTVHEKNAAIRAEGFAIAMQPNMLRVLESLGLGKQILAGGLLIIRRETRDEHDRPTMQLRGQGTHRVSRQHIVNVLSERARELGVRIEGESAATGADSSGALLLADGSRREADLVIGADGVKSAVRDSLDLLKERKIHSDGALRLLVSRTPEDVAEDSTLGPMTVEYWSGTRRVITSPCSADTLYVAMSCLASDAAAARTPIDVDAWARSFPHLKALFLRIQAEADWSRVRYSRFETLRLRSWHAGRVAVFGDAAHAMTPNLGQGSGCAMMNALSLACFVSENRSLADWEAQERPLTEHTQRWSDLYGRVTTWPAALRSTAFNALGKVGWLRRRYQRTANHIPTGCKTMGGLR